MKPTSFKIPEGYQPPEGVEDGSTFDESATFKISGGKLTLTALNGIPLDGNKDGEKAVADEPEPDLAARYQAAMQQPTA